MKKFLLLFTLLVILSIDNFAQYESQTGTMTITAAAYQIEKRIEVLKNKDGQPVYSAGDNSIGYVCTVNSDTSQTKKTYRTYYVFDFSSIKSLRNLAITNVKVNYFTNVFGYTFKLTKMSAISSDYQGNWNSISNSSALHTGIQYTSSSIISTPIKTAMNESISSGVLIVGALSEHETTSDSRTNLTINLEVTYTYEAPVFQFTAQNDMYGAHGGTIGVGINPAIPVAHPSPWSFTVAENRQITLAAYDNQNVDGRLWIFNDNEGKTDLSQWTKKVNGRETIESKSAMYTTPTVTSADAGTVYTAYLEDNSKTTNGTLAHDEKWFSNVTLTGDVVVPAGLTLRLRSGITVNLNGHGIKSTGGTIIQEGATLQGLSAIVTFNSVRNGYYASAQEAVNNADATASYGNNCFINLASKTLNETITITGKNYISLIGNGPENTKINGYINLNNSTGSQVEDLGFTDDHYVTVNGGTNVRISNVRVENILDFLSAFNTSNLNVMTMVAENGADIGGNIRNSSGSICYNSSFSNHMTAFYFSSGSNFSVTENTFCNNACDIYSDNSYVYIMNNYLSAPVPRSLGGAYTLSGNSSVCPSGAAPAQATEKTSENVLAKTSGLKSTGQPDEADKLYMDMISRINNGKVNLSNIAGNEILSVVEKYKNSLSKNRDKNNINKAMLRLSHCYKIAGDKNSFSGMLDAMLKDEAYKDVRLNLKKFKVSDYTEKGDYETAVSVADEILKESDDEDINCDMLYEKAIIMKEYLGDNDGAISALKTVIKQYPKNPVARMAKGQLKILGAADNGDKYGKIKKESSNSEGMEVGNYPNPFNPATTIKFSIPADGMTELKVYNMLGQTIETLVSENLSAGSYSYSWNAGKYSSGVYFYSLKSGNKIQTKRMLLVK